MPLSDKDVSDRLTELSAEARARGIPVKKFISVLAQAVEVDRGAAEARAAVPPMPKDLDLKKVAAFLDAVVGHDDLNAAIDAAEACLAANDAEGFWASALLAYKIARGVRQRVLRKRAPLFPLPESVDPAKSGGVK